MLFGYPVAATNDNWLHEGLIHAVQIVHQKVDVAAPLPEWPDIFPDASRDKVIRLRTLPKLIEEYRAAIFLIPKADRDAILDAMYAQNRIEDLLTCASDCPSIFDLPAAVREPVRNIFYCGFDLLTDFGIRHGQYKVIHGSIGARVCPFCGLEEFSAPLAPQEDFDHYLPKSIYPFAAVNLRNLVPMGHKCNSGYKRSKDILRSENGNRRKAFDPYNAYPVQLSLLNSEINPLVDGPFVSVWDLDIAPNAPEIRTWEEIFSIRNRYTMDVLEDRNFRDWIWDFKIWFDGRAIPDSDEKLIAEVKRYTSALGEKGYRDKAFIKAAVFDFLLHRLAAGCQRVLGLLRDATGMQQSIVVAE